MSERDRILAYLAGLVAVFVLALLAGRVAAQYVGHEQGHDPHAAAVIR